MRRRLARRDGAWRGRPAHPRCSFPTNCGFRSGREKRWGRPRTARHGGLPGCLCEAREHAPWPACENRRSRKLLIAKARGRARGSWGDGPCGWRNDRSPGGGRNLLLSFRKCEPLTHSPCLGRRRFAQRGKETFGQRVAEEKYRYVEGIACEGVPEKRNRSNVAGEEAG